MDKRIEQQEYLKGRERLAINAAIVKGRFLNMGSIEAKIISRYNIRSGWTTPLTRMLIIDGSFVGYGYENLRS
mgnify:CR=1 FL=1